jgi:hypothetical protein
MTSPSPQGHGPRLSGRVVLLAACLAPVLAACAGAAAQVHLPAKVTAHQKPAPAARPRLTSRQQVVVAFTGYTAAMATAFDSRSPAQVRQLLAPYLDTATIGNAVRAFSQAWAQNEVSYGHAEQHIIGIKIRGSAAWVHDCDNTSNSGLAYASTGQVVPGTLGSVGDNLVTRLNLVNGRWIVGMQTIEDVPCMP